MSTYDSLTDRNAADALIPEEISNEIIKALPMQSAALSLFRQTRMSRKIRRMPVVNSLPLAYFVNGDTGLKQTSEMDWTNKYLEAEEIAVIVPIPEAVLDDSEFDMWAEIKPLIVEAFGIKLDGAIIFDVDRPASWGPAIVPAAHAAGSEFVRGSVVDQPLDLDINDLMSLVEEDGYDVNGFVARKRIKGSLRGLRTTTGELIFQPSLQADTPDSIYGERVQYLANGSWVNADADLIAGDFMQGIVCTRQDLTWKVLTESVISDDEGKVILNLAQQDSVALRVVGRFAWQVPNPVNRMNADNDTRYPFAVLRPVGWTP
jgi:HK97 family phage major capsid protein